MTWQPVFATGGDPGEQGGSHCALYDLGSEVTCSTVTQYLIGHTGQLSSLCEGTHEGMKGKQGLLGAMWRLVT